MCRLMCILKSCEYCFFNKEFKSGIQFTTKRKRILLILISFDSKSYVLIFINSWVFTVVDVELSPGEKKKVHFVMEEHQYNSAQIETSQQLFLKRLQVANMCDQTLKGQTCYLKSKKICGLR